MFQPLLIRKHLRRRITPMLAALAVTLSTAMVIIVMSVMGGFLRQLETSVRNLGARCGN